MQVLTKVTFGGKVENAQEGDLGMKIGLGSACELKQNSAIRGSATEINAILRHALVMISETHYNYMHTGCNEESQR